MRIGPNRPAGRPDARLFGAAAAHAVFVLGELPQFERGLCAGQSRVMSLPLAAHDGRNRPRVSPAGLGGH